MNEYNALGSIPQYGCRWFQASFKISSPYKTEGRLKWKLSATENPAIKVQSLVPRDYWLEEWEKQAILAFHAEQSTEGYRRLTYRLMEQDLVAASPATDLWLRLSIDRIA